MITRDIRDDKKIAMVALPKSITANQTYIYKEHIFIQTEIDNEATRKITEKDHQ
jgi:hypothetical protein